MDQASAAMCNCPASNFATVAEVFDFAANVAEILGVGVILWVTFWRDLDGFRMRGDQEETSQQLRAWIGRTTQTVCDGCVDRKRKAKDSRAWKWCVTSVASLVRNNPAPTMVGSTRELPQYVGQASGRSPADIPVQPAGRQRTTPAATSGNNFQTNFFQANNDATSN